MESDGPNTVWQVGKNCKSMIIVHSLYPKGAQAIMSVLGNRGTCLPFGSPGFNALLDRIISKNI